MDLETCPKCGGDGWVEVMDPDHYGAVIGARPCPKCGGYGVIEDDDEEID